MPGELPETYVDGWHDPDVLKKMDYRTMPKFGKVSVISFGASGLGGMFTAGEGSGLTDAAGYRWAVGLYNKGYSARIDAVPLPLADKLHALFHLTSTAGPQMLLTGLALSKHHGERIAAVPHWRFGGLPAVVRGDKAV